MIALLLLILMSISLAQRWNPDFSQIQDGGYYKQVYDNYMREVDQAYEQQKQYMNQQPGYMQANQQYKQGLMDTYRQNNPRMDQFGNVMAGDPNAPTFLSCNGQGCPARG